METENAQEIKQQGQKSRGTWPLLIFILILIAAIIILKFILN